MILLTIEHYSKTQLRRRILTPKETQKNFKINNKKKQNYLLFFFIIVHFHIVTKKSRQERLQLTSSINMFTWKVSTISTTYVCHIAYYNSSLILSKFTGSPTPKTGGTEIRRCEWNFKISRTSCLKDRAETLIRTGVRQKEYFFYKTAYKYGG